MPRVLRRALRISVVVALGWVTACGTNDGIQVPGTSPGAARNIRVSPTLSTIQVGATAQMTVTLLDAADNEVPGSASWSSSNLTVASVTNQGLVRGLAAGASTITASSGTLSGSASVTVVDPASPTR